MALFASEAVDCLMAGLSVRVLPTGNEAVTQPEAAPGGLMWTRWAGSLVGLIVWWLVLVGNQNKQMDRLERER